ncbi:MAG: translation elongation factor Ts [Pseudomonadota bacterium]
MQISADMVKELRKRTGAGMMECKKALIECSSDIDAAIELLRKTGQAKADKKSSRIASEGCVVCKLDADKNQAVLLEINSETDFAANDESFKMFSEQAAATALHHEVDSIAALTTTTSVDSPKDKIEDLRLELINKIGENIQLRRVSLVQGDTNSLSYYMHGKKIGVVVVYTGGSQEVGRDIAMHIAASSPLCVDESGVSQELLDQERRIYMAQAEESGKPQDIMEKMVEGKVKKFTKEITLLNQPFVKDTDKVVKLLLEEEKMKVLNFLRYEVGEGIEKKEENFAEEVMSQAKGE